MTSSVAVPVSKKAKVKPGVTASVAVPVAKKAKVIPGAKKLKVKHVNIPKVFAQRATSFCGWCCNGSKIVSLHRSFIRYTGHVTTVAI